MEAVFVRFQEAYRLADGYLLATTITPVPPRHNPSQLHEVVRSSNAQQIQGDARYATIYNNALSLPKTEAQIWLDVYVAFWKVAVEVVTAEELVNQGRAEDANWSRVYEAWKEVANALIRGYSNGGFAAWSVPCLYVAGKYLRIFAIKADEHTARFKSGVIFANGFQDDIASALGNHDKLEDAARQINRIFSLCINDRCVTQFQLSSPWSEDAYSAPCRAPIDESRKWAIYYTINLLFKTYFKVGTRLSSLSMLTF